MGKIFHEWMRVLSGVRGAEVVHRMQEKHQAFFDEIEDDEAEDIGNFYEAETGRESEFDGDPNGPGRATYPGTGNVFEGRFVCGVREGRGVLRSGSKVTDGFYHDGMLVGNALTETADGATELFFCRRGKKHGFSRSVDARGLLGFGIYLNGSEWGAWWRRIEGDGWMVTRTHGDKQGQHQSIAAFLYPDLSNAICGEFENENTNRAIRGRHCRVIGVAELKSVLFPVFSAAGNKEDHLDFSPSSSCSICRNPTVADPFEATTVEIRPSAIAGAGDGLFARRDVPAAGELVAYFNGVCVSTTMATGKGMRRSDYSILLDSTTALDVPDQFRSEEERGISMAGDITNIYSTIGI